TVFVSLTSIRSPAAIGNGADVAPAAGVQVVAAPVMTHVMPLSVAAVESRIAKVRTAVVPGATETLQVIFQIVMAVGARHCVTSVSVALAAPVELNGMKSAQLRVAQSPVPWLVWRRPFVKLIEPKLPW